MRRSAIVARGRIIQNSKSAGHLVFLIGNTNTDLSKDICLPFSVQNCEQIDKKKLLINVTIQYRNLIELNEYQLIM